MDKIDRYEELEKVIDTLDSLYNTINSKDIKSNLMDMILDYENEKQDLGNEIDAEIEDDIAFLNKEYMRDAI